MVWTLNDELWINYNFFYKVSKKKSNPIEFLLLGWGDDLHGAGEAGVISVCRRVCRGIVWSMVSAENTLIQMLHTIWSQNASCSTSSSIKSFLIPVILWDFSHFCRGVPARFDLSDSDWALYLSGIWIMVMRNGKSKPGASWRLWRRKSHTLWYWEITVEIVKLLCGTVVVREAVWMCEYWLYALLFRFCDETRKNFEATLAWLQEHACSRTYGLGESRLSVSL